MFWLDRTFSSCGYIYSTIPSVTLAQRYRQETPRSLHENAWTDGLGNGWDRHMPGTG